MSSALEALIEKLEGFSSTPYPDQAGLWTIGYGHLIKPGDGYWSPDNPNGKNVVTRAEASAQLDEDMAVARDAVTRSVRVPLTDNQFSALVSLAYNIGAGAFQSSTLLSLLNSGDYAAAADQFAVWNKIHDPETHELIVSNGLTTRRETERETFLA